MQPLQPGPLTRYSDLAQEPELSQLKTLAESGFPVAGMVVVPPFSEQQFYALNNLGERLQAVFRDIDFGFPDDEDIEDLAPEAQRLIESNYLLEEFIDDFYESIERLPARLRVRRPGGEGIVATKGRPTLLALKRIWQADWSFESLWERLERGEPLLPPPRVVLIHTAVLEQLPPEVSTDAAALLGRPLRLRGDPGIGITAIEPADTQ